MNRRLSTPVLDREKVRHFGALGYLLVLRGLALAGPYGFIAWGENLSLLDQRQAQIKQLEKQRADLKNRVALLDPNHVDPDMASELVRSDLNVVHKDEYIYDLRDK